MSRFSSAPSAGFMGAVRAPRNQRANNRQALMDMLRGLGQAGATVAGSVREGRELEYRADRDRQRDAYNDRVLDLQQQRVDMGRQGAESAAARQKRMDEVADAQRLADAYSAIGSAGYSVEDFQNLHPNDQARIIGEARGLMDRRKNARANAQLQLQAEQQNRLRDQARERMSMQRSEGDADRKNRLEVAKTRAAATRRPGIDDPTAVAQMQLLDAQKRAQMLITSRQGMNPRAVANAIATVAAQAMTYQRAAGGPMPPFEEVVEEVARNLMAAEPGSRIGRVIERAKALVLNPQPQ